MDPEEVGFKSPTLDFFNPRNNLNRYSLTGIELKEKGLYVILIKQTPSRKRKLHEPIPSGVISSIYENDLGGLSFDFTDDVIYSGNGGGYVHLQIPDVEGTHYFYYDLVARVKNGQRVVWKNRHLKEASLEHDPISD